MDWDRISGNWKQFTGRVKEKWGKLTDDDLSGINGRRDQLEGKIQERYGYAKDQVRKDVDDWLSPFLGTAQAYWRSVPRPKVARDKPWQQIKSRSGLQGLK
jgi:uncharacterized protein YjbJ (UPF0337 family)